MATVTIHHVGLSVHDVEKSTDWYARLFDLAVVAEFDEPAPMVILMSPQGQAIDLRQDPRVTPDRFTQENVGLDHVGFVVDSREALDEWRRSLTEHGVEQSEIQESPFGWHLNFRDPDGIPLEFFFPRPAA